MESKKIKWCHLYTELGKGPQWAGSWALQFPNVNLENVLGRGSLCANEILGKTPM